jgi:lipopolysaccharide/colanic/teichoic acid biosynthesis glycosyltransferase
VAKANIRLKRPSSHTRLLSRVAVLDVAWGGVSPLVAFFLRGGTVPTSPAGAEGVAIYCGIATLISLLVFHWYQTSSPISRYYSIRDALDLLKACALIAALTAVVAFFLTRLEESPRSIPILHFMLLASGLLSGRVLLRLRHTRREANSPNPLQHVEHVLIIQASRLAWFFTKMVEELARGRYQIVAILDEAPKLKHRSLNGYPIIGAPADLEKVIADYAMHGVRIDKVVLAAQPEELSAGAWDDVTRICGALRIGTEVLPERLMADDIGAGKDRVIIPHPSAFAKITEDNLQISLDRPFWSFKRAIDAVVAVGATILLSPVILAVCVLVLIDVGIPVVFWQQRVGRNETRLHLYKFRTLHTLFDRQTKERREAQEPSPIGRFLQRTRFDELPQLWNVIAGEMSLVGPRPLLPVDQPSDSTVRLMVRPGLTGWAQICGGKAITAEEKNALDAWYIRHASLRLDMIIFIRTIWMLLVTGDRRDENAIAIAFVDSSLRDVGDTAGSIAPDIAGEPSGVVRRAGSALS